MLRSAGTHRAPSNFKDRKERHSHDRVPHNSQTSVHLANYTEKSLLVLKNYVFMEKNQGQPSHVFGGQGDAFMSEDMNGGGNMDIPTEIWENVKVNKRSEKTISKKKASGKPRTWLPNGGGIKPYNSPEAQRVVAPEECIIDVKSVKPKVDTWFKMKPKTGTKITSQDIQQVAKTNKDGRQSPKMNVIKMQRAATTIMKHHVDGKDKSVKNLTSFWNDHLQKHPLSVAQKSPTTDVGKRSPVTCTVDDPLGKPSNPKSRRQTCLGRPKSVGSDGVILEHTLQPSKILSEKNKLSSVEDIIVFARLSGTRKSEGNGAIMGKQQVLNGKRRPETAEPSNDDSLKKRVPSQRNTKMKSPRAITHEKAKHPVRRPRSRDHPKFVVRLHPRWILALRVLALSFRPVMDTCRTQVSAGMLKSADVHVRRTQTTSCLMTGKIIKETLASSVKRCSERFGKLKLLARRGMSETLRMLTDGQQFGRMGVASTYEPYAIVRWPQPLHALVRPNFRLNRVPLVTEPTSTAFSAVVGTRHLKTASLEVLPRGVRIVLYIEYHLLFSFILVQTILLVIVLFIKWLQEYTM